MDGCAAGNHPLVNRLMRGIFNLRASTPRYNDTWDVKPVLDKLRTMEPLHNHLLKDLTLKLMILLVLTQAARVQTLHLLVLRDISKGENYISIWLEGNIKQCWPGCNVQFIKFHAYMKDLSLCVHRALSTYLDKTNHLREMAGGMNGRLLISFVKPHCSVSRDTIA